MAADEAVLAVPTCLKRMCEISIAAPSPGHRPTNSGLELTNEQLVKTHVESYDSREP
jgi:hypothetical protein